MFGKRKPTMQDLAVLVERKVKPVEFAPMLYEASMGKYYLQTGNAEYEIAKSYGGTLLASEDLMTFYKAVKPKDSIDGSNANWFRWRILSSAVAHGFMEAGRIKTVADVLAVCNMFSGSNWEGTCEWLEGELIKRSSKLFKNHEEILSFACALKTYKGLMVFAISLGYLPLNTFDEAVKAHKEELLRIEEEERRRSVSAF